MDELVDPDSVFAHGDVSGMGVDPGSAVVVVDAMDAVASVHGGVGVSAKDALRMLVTGVGQSSVGDFFGEALPARAEAVEKTGQGFIFRVPLLQLQVEYGAEPIVEANVLQAEAVELMAVGGDVAQAVIIPLIFLEDADADEVGHDFGESVIVIAFNPDDFDVAFGIGELADEAEKFPVFFFEASEIEVGEDVAEENEAAITIFAEDAEGIASAAHIGTEMQIRQDQRVILRQYDRRRHGFIVARKYY